MPTENRSSNTEMVSVPRGLLQCAAREPSGEVINVSRRHALESLRDLLAQPSPQPHPEPIAWMVGTAFWWTKEEAGRDSAATGLPIVGLGPMSGAAPAEQFRGEPVVLPAAMHPHDFDTLPEAHCDGWNACLDEITMLGPLYTHADPGEVERLKTSLSAVKFNLDKTDKGLLAADAEVRKLRALLTERDALLQRMKALFRVDDPFELYDSVCAALSASAEQSAPNDCAICRDLGDQCVECEEGEFREWADRHFAAADYRKTDAGVFIQDWMRHAYGAWCARGALVRKT